MLFHNLSNWIVQFNHKHSPISMKILHDDEEFILIISRFWICLRFISFLVFVCQVDDLKEI